MRVQESWQKLSQTRDPIPSRHYALATMISEPSGRLVWNHSTHIPGLIPVLERLTQQRGIKTVTPGALSRSRGRIPQLQLRVSVPIRGGYKLVARKGNSVQEVFVVTELSQAELEAAILSCLR